MCPSPSGRLSVSHWRISAAERLGLDGIVQVHGLDITGPGQARDGFPGPADGTRPGPSGRRTAVLREHAGPGPVYAGVRMSTGPAATGPALEILHLSSVIKRPLVDAAGDRLGRVQDLIVRVGESPHPPVVGLVVDIGGRDLFVPIRKVAAFEPGRVAFEGRRVDLRRFERRPGELLLARDLLAHHLINFVGGRLIRANEIELAKVDGAWEVVGVDPSSRPVLRRLLPGRWAGIPSRAPWSTGPASSPSSAHVPSSRLRIPYRKLAKLHPAQIADLVEAASHEEGEEIIEAVGADRELEADVFEELDTEHQLEFVRARSDEEAARLLASMAPDDAADLITEVDQERRLPILEPAPGAPAAQGALAAQLQPRDRRWTDEPGLPRACRRVCDRRRGLDAIRRSTAPPRRSMWSSPPTGGRRGRVGLGGATDPGRSHGCPRVGGRCRARARPSGLGPRRHRPHHVRLQSDGGPGHGRRPPTDPGCGHRRRRAGVAAAHRLAPRLRRTAVEDDRGPTAKTACRQRPVAPTVRKAYRHRTGTESEARTAASCRCTAIRFASTDPGPELRSHPHLKQAPSADERHMPIRQLGFTGTDTRRRRGA